MSSLQQTNEKRRSGEDLVDDAAVDVGEAVAATLKTVGEPLVIDPHQMHERCMKVVDVDPIPDDVVPELAGFAVTDSPLHAAAGHPHREAARMMVSPEISPRRVMSLTVVRSPELSPPDDKRVVEHSPVSKILNERRRGLIGLPRLPTDTSRQATVMVPILMVELDESHAPLRQSPCQQAVGGKRPRIARPWTLLLNHMRRLVGEIRDIGDARLHPEGEFIVGDSGRYLRIGVGRKLVLVEVFEPVERRPTALA